MANNYYMIGIGALLAGCSFSNKNCQTTPVDNDTYVTTVSKGDKSYLFSIQTDISDDDRKQLKKLAQKLVSDNVGKVTLTPVVRSQDNANMYKDTVKEVKNIFTRAGVPIYEIYINPAQVDSQRNGIRIEASTYTANLPTAKTWKYPLGDFDDTKGIPNFGVSSEYNLGAMIASPKDLVDPAPLDNMDAPNAIAAVKKIIKSNAAGAGATAGSSGGTTGGAASSSPSK